MDARIEKTLKQIVKEAALAAHPVGGIYIRTDEVNPSTLFGGTWERYAFGRVMIGADDSHSLGSVGGEETHTLTLGEIPPHNHSYERAPLWYSEKTGGSDIMGSDGSLDTYIVANSGYSGGGQPHNNMQPYIAVAIWRRTA